ncbi:MAG: acyl-CoA desaturase [Gemmataceae bacterium]
MPQTVRPQTSTTTPAKPRVMPLFLGILISFHLLLPICFFEPFFTWWFPVYLIVGNFIFGSIGINLAYHRLLTHRSLVVPAWLERTMVFCGICSLEGPPFKWVCTHRIHHQKSDIEEDPHSPKDSFFWGHMGWIYTRDPRMESFLTYDKYIPDLLEDAWLRSLHKKNKWAKLYLLHLVGLLAIAAGIGYAIDGVDGLIIGTAQMFAWGIIARTVYVWHITWFVNSAAHRWGYQNYKTGDLSRNTWWVALLTNGEGWHNNHHAAPRSASHGHRWWEVDLTYTFIRVLEMVGLASKVVPVVVPKHRQDNPNDPTPAAIA